MDLRTLSRRFDGRDPNRQPPTSHKEATEWRECLVLLLKEIELQLQNKDRKDPDGSRLTSKDYWEWRNKAQTAKLIFEKKLIVLKRLCQELHKKERIAHKEEEMRKVREARSKAAGVDLNDPDGIILKAFRVFGRFTTSMDESGQTPPQEVRDILATMRYYLNDKGLRKKSRARPTT